METSTEWMFPSQPLESGITGLWDWAVPSQAGLATQLCRSALPAKIPQKLNIFPVSSACSKAWQQRYKCPNSGCLDTRESAMDQWIGSGTHTCALSGAVSTGLSWELSVLPNSSFRQWGRRLGVWSPYGPSTSKLNSMILLSPSNSDHSVILHLGLFCTVWAFSLPSFLLFCLLTLLLLLY